MKKLSITLFSGIILFLILSFTLTDQVKESAENPFKVTVIYGQPEDPAAFEEYYWTTHRLLAEKIEGVGRMELTKFANTAEGEAPAFYRMAELYFPDAAAMEKVFSSAAGKAAVDDIANFATGGVTMMIGTAEDFKFVKL